MVKLEKLPTISIVVPVYCNADSLEELSARLVKTLRSLHVAYEIIFINDACPADSLTVLKKIIANDPLISLVSLQYNVGQHLAILFGLYYARGIYTVLMDADLQDSPEDILKLYLAITTQSHFSAIYARRTKRAQSRLRHFTSHFFKGLVAWLCGMPKNVGLFVILNSELKQKLLSYNIKRPYLTAMISCTQLKVGSIPIQRQFRPYGKSTYSSWMRVKLSITSLITLWQIKRHATIQSNGIPLWQQYFPPHELLGHKFRNTNNL